LTVDSVNDLLVPFCPPIISHVKVIYGRQMRSAWKSRKDMGFVDGTSNPRAVRRGKRLPVGKAGVV